MKQIINAVKYIHSQGIIHRDLKLDNILVKFFNKNDYDSVNLLNAQIKIIDFGFATYKNSGNLARTAMGSPFMMKKPIFGQSVPYVIKCLLVTVLSMHII